MKSTILDFYTHYHQFYLVDKDSSFKTDSENFWTKQALEDKLAIEEGIIGIGTECYGHVKGELHILATATTIINLETFDHVVEGSIDIKSGILQLWPCRANEPVLEMELEKGWYRVRAYSSNLESVEFDEGDDFYKLEMWKQERTDRTVLKR